MEGESGESDRRKRRRNESKDEELEALAASVRQRQEHSGKKALVEELRPFSSAILPAISFFCCSTTLAVLSTGNVSMADILRVQQLGGVNISALFGGTLPSQNPSQSSSGLGNISLASCKSFVDS